MEKTSWQEKLTNGIILNKGEKYFTFLHKIFGAIDDSQKEFNWLITNYECYPQIEEYTELFSEQYVWISGEQLTEIIEKDDFQWVWGVLSGFKKSLTKEEVMESYSPQKGYETFWESPISMQHPLADVEIAAIDSTATLFISKEKKLLDMFYQGFPLAEDLQKFNHED